jgi:hypothetical protein
MNLVSSNDSATVQRTIATAMAAYWGAQPAAETTSAALDGISTLRGVGPATASLLLSVHDPARVVFFSDEAFYWLCAGGSNGRAPLQYSAKEYRALQAAAQALVARLGVSATDVEKVAYVVRKGTTKTEGGDDGAAAGPAREDKKKEKKKQTKKGESVPARRAPGKQESVKEVKEEPKKKAKRKEQPVVEEQPITGLRRSKRSKPSN